MHLVYFAIFSDLTLLHLMEDLVSTIVPGLICPACEKFN